MGIKTASKEFEETSRSPRQYPYDKDQEESYLFDVQIDPQVLFEYDIPFLWEFW